MHPEDSENRTALVAICMVVTWLGALLTRNGWIAAGLGLGLAVFLFGEDALDQARLRLHERQQAAFYRRWEAQHPEVLANYRQAIGPALQGLVEPWLAVRWQDSQVSPAMVAAAVRAGADCAPPDGWPCSALRHIQDPSVSRLPASALWSSDDFFVERWLSASNAEQVAIRRMLAGGASTRSLGRRIDLTAGRSSQADAV